VFRIRDPVLFTPWIRDKFFPDPGSGPFLVKFIYIIFRILVMLRYLYETGLRYLYETGLLSKLTPETISSKKKVPVC
jgi:hypothetical protein